MKQVLAVATVCSIVFEGGCSAPKPKLLPYRPASESSGKVTRRVATDRVVLESGQTRDGIPSLELIHAGKRYNLFRGSSGGQFISSRIEQLAISKSGTELVLAGSNGTVWEVGLDGLPPHDVVYRQATDYPDMGGVVSLDSHETLTDFITTVGFENGEIRNTSKWSKPGGKYKLPAAHKLLWTGLALRHGELIAVDSALTIYRWRGGQKPAEVGQLLGGVKHPTAFALSPSGQQMAIVHDGFLTVFELDPKPGQPLTTRGGFPDKTAIYYNDSDILRYCLPDGRRGTIE